MRIENNREIRSQRAMRWMVLALVIVAVAVVLVLLLPGQETGAAVNTAAVPTYPERVACPVEADYYDDNGELDWDSYMADYDLWWEDQQSRLELPADYAAGLEGDREMQNAE